MFNYMNKSFSIGVLTAVFTGLLLTSCAEEKKKAHDAAQHKTMVVGRKDVTLQRQYSARMTGRQIVEVRPQVSGCITRICINEGQAVKKGQVLFVIDQVPYRAALESAVASRKSAEARLATAQINYENEMQLKEGHVVSDVSVKTVRNALLEAESALAQAKAQELNARNNLSYTEVKSPVSGVASIIPWHIGSLRRSSPNNVSGATPAKRHVCRPPPDHVRHISPPARFVRGTELRTLNIPDLTNQRLFDYQ